jgi:hypothetical protein
MIKLLMVVLSYSFAGLLLAAIAKDSEKSLPYCIGILIAWPLYVWFYAFYYGAQFIGYVFRSR